MRSRERAKNDFYRTPPECAALIKRHLPKHQNWWECCAGDGVIVDISKRITLATDLQPRRSDILKADILTCEKPSGIDAVVTNPPFNIAENIMERILFDFNLPLLFLVRVEFMNALKRKKLQDCVAHMDIVSELIKFETEGGRIINGNGTGRCAWFYMTPSKNVAQTVSWVAYERTHKE